MKGISGRNGCYGRVCLNLTLQSRITNAERICLKVLQWVDWVAAACFVRFTEQPQRSLAFVKAVQGNPE